jgi:nicotinate-nucleotide adenylyltransferase
MNIAFFGGTFDPVHRGHLAVARAAAEKFDLAEVLFVPNFVPPHREQPHSAYHHRLAMVALATQEEKRFVACDLESPEVSGESKRPSYSLESIRRLKARSKKADRIFYLLGVDAFLGIAKWHKPVELLRECEFIVVSRPGFSLAQIASALPETIRPSQAILKAARQHDTLADDGNRTLVLQGATLHLLDTVAENVSATQIRAAAAKPGARLERYVGEAVAEYIRKTRLYRGQRAAAAASTAMPAKSKGARGASRS